MDCRPAQGDFGCKNMLRIVTPIRYISISHIMSIGFNIGLLPSHSIHI
ncbi:unnamed protein product [Brugia timori]|uniref:Uncharacterized protein n=1 Tax=Brugia timori TaxID=42155 RepID=A0A0R3QZC7_9BILA|nr:unnamed protein product [Brugia timori]